MFDRVKNFPWLKTGQGLAAASLIILALYLLYYVATAFFSLEKEIKVALIAAVVTLGVAIVTNYVQKKRELDFRIRERKVEAYQKFFEFLRFFLTTLKKTETADPNLDDFVKWFHEVNYAFVIWGSDSIIKEWQEFYVWLKGEQPEDSHQGNLMIRSLIMRQKLAEIILMIRKDLGHIDKSIDAAAISDLYLPINFTSEDWQLIHQSIESGKVLPSR